MRFTRPTIVGITLALLFSLLSAAPASAVPTDDAVGWLDHVQDANGGWTLSGFDTGQFETPDAVLAIATEAQTTTTWSTAEALTAVQAVDNGGVDALDWADDFVDGGATAAAKAKVALLIALPLGLNPVAFDPQGDGATDLTADLDTVAPGLFNSFLFAQTAKAAIGENVHQNDVQTICEAQHINGGWSFDGVADGANTAGVDTSGFAAIALNAAGVEAGDAVIDSARAFLAGGQTTGGVDAGSWSAFGSADPNATAVAVMGFLATEGVIGGVTDPRPWLDAQQVTTVGAAPDDVIGRIQSPSDGFGVNSFATSQAVQGHEAVTDGTSWLSGIDGVDRECLAPHGFSDVPSTAWNDDAMRWLNEFGVATGYPDGSYRPGDVFNRAQASLWFDRFFPAVVGTPNTFSDVPSGIWYESGADFVGDGAWPGGPIASGFLPGNEFRATDPFKRGQAVLWMYRAAGSPSVAGLPAHGLSDAAPWYEDALTWAKANGIVNGFPDGTFRPGKQITRAQGAFWFYNLAASRDAWDPAIALPTTIVHTP